MGTFVEGESMFYDGQGREPAGCSFLPGGCLALCILLDSLFVNTLAVIRLRWLSSGCVGVELFEPCSSLQFVRSWPLFGRSEIIAE